MAAVLAIIYLIPGILAALFGKKHWLAILMKDIDYTPEEKKRLSDAILQLRGVEREYD